MGGLKILNVIIGMSYNMPKALISEYQSPRINPFNPISTKKGSEN